MMAVIKAQVRPLVVDWRTTEHRGESGYQRPAEVLASSFAKAHEMKMITEDREPHLIKVNDMSV